MRAPSRLLLAALVAGATGVASASGATAAVEVAGAAGAISLARSAASSCSSDAGRPLAASRGTCIALGCSVRSDLAALSCAPMVACIATPTIYVATTPIAVVAPDAPRSLRPARAVIPFAPKTSPPTA